MYEKEDNDECRIIAVRGKLAASRKLQALMGAYYRLSAFNGIKEGLRIRKFKASCLKKYFVAVNALSAINRTQIFMIFKIYHDKS